MKIIRANLWGILGFTSLLLIGVMQASCQKNGSTTVTPNPTVTLKSEITINGADLAQIIQGFGCATVFKPSTAPLSTEELDRLFGKAAGQVGLSILRIRITEDANWKGFELQNAKGAIQRGAIILATPWSPPARFKTNNNLIGGSLITDSSLAYANYLNNFAAYMSSNGAPLYAVSVQNEPDIKVSYEGCEWTSAQMQNFVKNYGHLITNTRLMAPESFNNNATYVNDLLLEPTAAANTDLIGGHIYGGGIMENSLAKTMGKPVWMTEHLDTNFNYNSSLATAAEIHDCFSKANFSAYIWWYGKRFYGPIGEDGLVTKRGTIMSHFARYIPSGSTRINTGTNTQTETKISAYKTPTGKLIIVAVNSYPAYVNQIIQLKDLTVGSMIPYTTTEKTDMSIGTAISVVNNRFSVTLPPSSITTFVTN